jgi:hypothetical protein
MASSKLQIVPHLIILVDDKTVSGLARFLSQDHTAVTKREQIYSELGLPSGELVDLNRRHANDPSGSYQFFFHALNTFYALNGSTGATEKLLDCFKELRLNSVIGNLALFKT